MTEAIAEPTSNCPNCGQPMTGPYCAGCGQQDKEVRRPFLYLLREIIQVVFELDGRAYRTVYYLLTRPGFLTMEYFSGRRMSYTPPLRLFLVISIGFFLLVGVVSSLHSLRQSFIEQAQPELAAQIEQDGDSDQGIDVPDTGDEAVIDPDDDDLEDIRVAVTSLSLPFLSEQANQNLRAVLTAQVDSNIEEVLDDPQDFFIGSLEYVTVFMLLMMPLLALIQKILFVFAGKYYIEHLVLTLHNHAFLVLAFFLTMILGALDDTSIPLLSGLFNLMNLVIILWIVLYLYLSLKTCFGRGYFLTGVLFFTASIAYGALLAVGFLVFAVILFIFA